MSDLLERKRAIIQEEVIRRSASILHAETDAQSLCRVITIDLGTARLETDPLPVGFPFAAVCVDTATDKDANVSMRLQSRDIREDAFTIKRGRQLRLPGPINKAFLHWSAQTGKTIRLVFFFDGVLDNNTLDLVNSGGVSITDGDAVEVQTTATVSTAAQLFASDTARKKMMICNASGLTIYLGDSTVTDNSGTKMGIPVPAGASYAWENTAACYAVSQGGASTGQLIGLVKFS